MSLAEALNRYDVCKALLEDLGAITSANVDWWMSWLGKEHNVVLNLDPIRIKLGQFFKLRLFSGAGFYACLNDEVLLALQAATKKLEEHEASSRALKRSRKL